MCCETLIFLSLLTLRSHNFQNRIRRKDVIVKLRLKIYKSRIVRYFMFIIFFDKRYAELTDTEIRTNVRQNILDKNI